VRPGEQSRGLVPRGMHRRHHGHVHVARMPIHRPRGFLFAAGRDGIDVQEILVRPQEGFRLFRGLEARRSGDGGHDQIGAAAAIKMVRSVMVKGLEALTLECFLAARRAGVEEQIFASLGRSYPGVDWGKQVEYNLERMANHGIRRAHEMEEVADTLRELGIDPHMTAGTIRRQQEMGDLGKREPLRSAVPQGRTAILDAIGQALIDEKAH